MNSKLASAAISLLLLSCSGGERENDWIYGEWRDSYDSKGPIDDEVLTFRQNGKVVIESLTKSISFEGDYSVGDTSVSVFVMHEGESKQILDLTISKEKKMLTLKEGENEAHYERR